MGDFDEALRADWAYLHVGESVVATIALESDVPAPPIILWKDYGLDRYRVFRQAVRGFDSWRYNEVDALIVN